MKEILTALLRERTLRRDCALVTIIDGCGSTPRGPGARMLVGAGGRIAGTIGGGLVEYKAEHLALKALRDKATGSARFDLSPHAEHAIGMVCGGSVTVLIQFLDGGDTSWDEALHALPALFREDAPFTLTTDTKTGKIRIAMPDSYPDLPHRRTGLWTHDEHEYFYERHGDQGTVYIFGGGHVSQELVPLLGRLDFRCVVLDDRAEYADKTLFPTAERVLLIDYSKVSSIVALRPCDYVVVMTRGHAHDTEVQAQVLSSDVRYIGVMGSAQKKRAVDRALVGRGFDEAAISRIRTPIGLDIGAETPAEIAVSIAAEMVLIRAGRN